MKTRHAAITALVSVAGLALFVYQVRNVVGLDQLWSGLAKPGPWWLAILALSFGRYVARAYGWTALLAGPVPLTSTLAATLSGDALGNVTPLGPLASEPAKAIFLGRHTDRSRALAALTAENFFYGVSLVIYVLIGAAALLSHFALPDAVRWTTLVIVAATSTALAIAGWIAWQKPAAASMLLSWLPSRRLGALVARVRSFEEQTYGSTGHQGARLGIVAISEAGFHFLSFAECCLTLWLLTGRWQPLAALVFDSVNRVINVAFRVVFLRAGVDEAGARLIAPALGIDPSVGVVMAVVRKIRLVVWMAVGLGMWMGRRRTRPQ